MSLDLSALRFFENIRLENPTGTWIDQQLVTDCAGLAATNVWPVELSGCPLADIGNYLLRVLHMLASFAGGLVGGDVISTHLDEKMQELVAEDDLHTANFLDDKHAALRKITDQLRQALEDCSSTWSFTLSSTQTLASSQASHRPSHSSASADQNYVTSSTPRFESPVTTSDTLDPTMGSQSGSNAYPPTYESAPWTPANVPVPTTQDPAFAPNAWPRGDFGPDPSPGNTSEANDTDIPSLDQLKARGKGRYVCPHGRECTKGGVQPNGELTVFERNSAFRAHQQMHERLFRCDLPGCTNKKGFSRIDQLERHKSTVKHIAPGGNAFVNSAG